MANGMSLPGTRTASGARLAVRPPRRAGWPDWPAGCITGGAAGPAGGAGWRGECAGWTGRPAACPDGGAGGIEGRAGRLCSAGVRAGGFPGRPARSSIRAARRRPHPPGRTPAAPPPSFSADGAQSLSPGRSPTGIEIGIGLRLGFSLAPRGTSGARVGERGRSTASKPPLPGPLLHCHGGEGEDPCVARPACHISMAVGRRPGLRNPGPAGRPRGAFRACAGGPGGGRFGP